VAGHAPEFLPPSQRLLCWLAGISDLRISLYMLIATGLIAAMLYMVDRRFFG
jgi:hypothetical protein